MTASMGELSGRYDEHVLVALGREVGAEQTDWARRHAEGARGLGGLGRAEPQATVSSNAPVGGVNGDVARVVVVE